MTLRPPNLTLFIDVLAIFLFVFMFLPTYSEPRRDLQPFDPEVFPIFVKRDGTYNRVTIEANGTSRVTTEKLPATFKGFAIVCDGWCADTLGPVMARDAIVLVTGENFVRFADRFLSDCIGNNPLACDRDLIAVIEGQGLYFIEDGQI